MSFFTWNPAGIMSQLEGKWLIERITLGEPAGEMKGEAAFTTRANAQVDYHEEGILRLLGGHKTDAFQDYIYQQAAGGFEIYFASGAQSLFQAVDLAPEGDKLIGTAIHHCAPDIYQSRYDFLPDGTFRVKHEVTGPRKAYVMRTHYRRNPQI